MFEKLELYMKRADGTYKILGNVIEGITNGFININSDHAAHHLGYGYNVSKYMTFSSEEVKTFAIVSPSNLFMHIKNVDIKVLGGSVHLEILKNPTITLNTGTIVTARNTNDNSTNTASSVIRESPTFSGGDLWDEDYALTDATNQFVGVGGVNPSVNLELISKDSQTEYIIRLTNLSTNSVTGFMKMFFYEEPQGLVTV